MSSVVWPVLFLVFNGMVVGALLYIALIIHELPHVATAKLVDNKGQYLVTMVYGQQLFSLTILGIPMRIVIAGGE
ncbi:MAG: hypothetical protein KGZ92_03370 [Firmicutes bacterium]|nr:hypothetical protein [Dethiobacter sp.]MBS3888329.1 hypothetical protein [Bacillota bacterium]MBS4055419.1 hypothetical protein [Thermaerobacter sp.]